MKIIVVGGGIIGLSIAWRVARNGADVALLERNNSVAQEASWAAAGMLAPLAEVVETPGAFFQFGLDSLKLYPRFLQDLTDDGAEPPPLSKHGILRLAFDQPAFSKLKSQEILAHESGLDAKILSPGELWDMEPSVTRSHLVLGALLSSDERHIDPRLLAQSLAKACANLGVEIVTCCEVASINHDTELIVKTNAGDYIADKLVIASGAWAATLAKSLDIHLPIYPRKGQVIAVRPPEGVLISHTIYSHQTYCVPRDGRILIGATQQDVGFDRAVTKDATKRLLDGAETLVPGMANAEVVDEWMGFRPACADNMPVIGASDLDQRIYFAVGHQRNGVLLAPMTCQSVCEELLWNKPIQSLATFRPNRFAVRREIDTKRKKVVLVIAGSDPSGGAGIQADQRVIESLGCEAVCIATALTSQNSHGVTAVFPVPIDTLRSQLETLLADIRPDSVKIGLLPSAEHVEFVAEMISAYNLPNVVLDPVIAPSYGQPFLYERGIEAFRKKLLPLVTLVTPNIQEVTEICEMRISTREDMEASGRMLIEKFGVKNALIKGGHFDGEKAEDVLIEGEVDEPKWFSADWIETSHTHGTGCALSSAIASQLVRGCVLQLAVRTSKAMLVSALIHPRTVGSGHGSPGMLTRFDSDLAVIRADRLAKLAGIYYVTDDRMPIESVYDSVLAAITGGVKVIQLRRAMGRDQDLWMLIFRLRSHCLANGALLIVNNRADLAKTAGADGVHVGPGDISPFFASSLLGRQYLVGISAGSPEEVKEYKVGGPAYSYIGCGPVFGTKTKADAGEAIGLGALSKMKEAYPNNPIIAIGGITLENLPEVAKTGVAGAAVVSAISQASDPEAAARALVECWNKYSPNS